MEKKKLNKIYFIEKIIQIKRVTKVTKGGKNLTFTVLLVIGNELNQIGLGKGNAKDINIAINKAIINGKKNLIKINITSTLSIPHIIEQSFGSSKIILHPGSIGQGIIAGEKIRPILELAGFKNISAKQIGSKNVFNCAKATILALKKLTDIIEIKKNQLFKYLIFYNKNIFKS